MKAGSIANSVAPGSAMKVTQHRAAASEDAVRNAYFNSSSIHAASALARIDWSRI
jgi:hypothetical protein